MERAILEAGVLEAGVLEAGAFEAGAFEARAFESGAFAGARINIGEPAELRYWSAHFAVTPAELACAVRRAGPWPVDVERALDPLV
jgi:hypothetical protein